MLRPVAPSDVRVPSQERAIRTRASLVDAAQREFSKRGYAAATAKSIAEEAGVATGSFYQYFKDKDQILHELARDRLARVTTEVQRHVSFDGLEGRRSKAELERALRDRMRALVEVVVAYHREDPGLHAVLTERRHADETLDRMTSQGEEALVRYVSLMLQKLGREDDVEALAFVLFGMVEGTVHAHVLGRPLVDDDRLASALVDALVHAAVA